MSGASGRDPSLRSQAAAARLAAGAAPTIARAKALRGSQAELLSKHLEAAAETLERLALAAEQRGAGDQDDRR